jgi:hypothetical protein
MNARLSDFDHPTVSDLASLLTSTKGTPLEKVESSFHYVCDEIKFGFTLTWDIVKASEIIYHGLGYGNTKATLLVALCRAAGIPARVHFGLIDVRIMHGILPEFDIPMLPEFGGHSLTEVQLDGEWKALDSYINNKLFYERAVERLDNSRRPLGYFVSYRDGTSSCEFNFGERGFVHMGTDHEDHGTRDDAADYFSTDKYLRFTTLQALGYPLLAVMANRNVARMRQRPA